MRRSRYAAALLLISLALCNVAADIIEPAALAPYISVPLTVDVALTSVSNLRAVGAEWRLLFAAAVGNASRTDLILIASATINDSVVDFPFDDEANGGTNTDAGSVTQERRLRQRALQAVGPIIVTNVYYRGLQGDEDVFPGSEEAISALSAALSTAAGWSSLSASAQLVLGNPAALAQEWTDMVGRDELEAVQPKAARQQYRPFGNTLLASDVGGFIGTGIVLLAIALIYAPSALDKWQARRRAARGEESIDDKDGMEQQ